MRYWSNSGRTD